MMIGLVRRVVAPRSAVRMFFLFGGQTFTSEPRLSSPPYIVSSMPVTVLCGERAQEILNFQRIGPVCRGGPILELLRSRDGRHGSADGWVPRSRD